MYISSGSATDPPSPQQTRPFLSNVRSARHYTMHFVEGKNKKINPDGYDRGVMARENRQAINQFIFTDDARAPLMIGRSYKSYPPIFYSSIILNKYLITVLFGINQ